MTPTLSAVIVTHNSAAVIDSCVHSLRARLPQVEVIVVDNASSDDTITRCERATRVTVVCNATNAGFGRGCNQGARLATGSHLLFLNPDVQLLEADGAALTSELRQHPCGLVGLSFRDGDRTAPLLLTESYWPFDVIAHGLGPLRPRELPRLPRLPLRRHTRWPAGAALICSRAEFREIGGFRSEFFLYYEDRDLARRYRAARLPLRTTRSVVVRHASGTSSASDEPLRLAASGWGYLGWLEYLATWHGDATARRAAACVGWLWDQATRALAVLEAHGPMSSRACRKREQLRGIEAFVQSRCTGANGAADDGFCPRGRAAVAQRGL
jgi:N-acetylglucosaminyl-diphospho-decaprenol L-rhamnosyltransferase